MKTIHLDHEFYFALINNEYEIKGELSGSYIELGKFEDFSLVQDAFTNECYLIA